MEIGISLAVTRRGGGATALVASTWNPADKSADITLTNGDLTATHTTPVGFDTARGTKSLSSGKRYFEGTVSSGDTTTNTAIGWALSTADLNSYIGQDTATGGGYYSTGFIGGTPTTGGASFTVGDKIGIALDMDADKWWCSKNGAWQFGDPVAGTGGNTMAAGTIFPAFSDQTGGGMTFNGGAAAFTHAPPTGYTAWDA